MSGLATGGIGGVGIGIGPGGVDARKLIPGGSLGGAASGWLCYYIECCDDVGWLDSLGVFGYILKVTRAPRLSGRSLFIRNLGNADVGIRSRF